MSRSASLLVALLLATAVPSTQAAPQAARASTAAKSPFAALTPQQRQAVVLLTGGRVEQQLGGLPKRSPKEAVDALKTVSVAYEGMSALSAQAGWPEMARYYADTSALFARMVRGGMKREAIEASTKALETRRRALTQAAIKRLQAAGIGPADPQLAAAASQLASQIDRRARSTAATPRKGR